MSLLSLVAMFYAVYGSYLFVKSDFETGSKSFMVGNAINVAIGIAIGDIALITSQAALAYFTIPMYSDKRFNSILTLTYGLLFSILGTASSFGFTASIIGIIGTITAVYGAYRMSKGDFKTMAWMWIIADILFIYIAIADHLPGLFLQSLLFVWHGYLRLTGRHQTGLFSFSK